MSFKTTLQTAADRASITIVDGYEIDTVGSPEAGVVRLSCADEYDFDLNDGEIEIDSDGCTKLIDRDGNTVHIEFRVSRPMTAADL